MTNKVQKNFLRKDFYELEFLNKLFALCHLLLKFLHFALQKFKFVSYETNLNFYGRAKSKGQSKFKV